MERGIRVWVRTPVIPGATDSSENIEAIGRFLAEAGLPERWELCAFNNLCRDKYERLDLDWKYKETSKMPKASLEQLAALARRYVPATVYTGMTAD
jgi:pyruvate formate lyase activating enzyme